MRGSERGVAVLLSGPRDVVTGEERARVDTGGGMQSVLFPVPGWDRDLYLCSFLTVTRVEVVDA